MGFGILFFGYFLILNLTYYAFTDLIAALLMAMGLYKLSCVNKPFRGGFYASLIFAAVGAFELIVQILAMFKPSASFDNLLSYTDIFRYAVIAVVTLFILSGIESVASEVGLSELAKKAHITIPVSLVLYFLLSVLNVQNLESIIDTKVLAWLSVIFIISAFILTIVNLFTVYGAYMKICMPEDKDNLAEDKPSKFGFVNRFREHSRERTQEYINYRADKFKKKNSKKKK